MPTKWLDDKNFHTKQAGTYDCILLMTLYKICKDKVSIKDIEDINNKLLLEPFNKLKFINFNHKIYKSLMYKVFKSSESRCKKYDDFKMKLDDYCKDKPLHYDFTFCPLAEFAKRNNLQEVMPALCNGDYYAMEKLKARLIRKYNCVTDNICDLTIVGDENPLLKEHEQYIDEKGYVRNK